jgi:hypothetical protein
MSVSGNAAYVQFLHSGSQEFRIAALDREGTDHSPGNKSQR